MSAALALLKKARGTRGYLYEQPWYAIIGPPGAGKTTALLNAGLKFPLAAEMGQGAVAGVGGTRLCDWWFTENAVLIDTAGRYTTQDSNAAVDRAGWDAFLDLLRRTRPRQPLNGVIVAIALSDIAQAPADERLAHARAIRRRIKELGDQLGIRMPVYALFTKADLLAGFTEFFADLDRERREQVWGATFPLSKTGCRPGRGVRGRVAAAGGAAERAAVRSPASRTQPGPARADRRISRAGGQPRGAAAGVPDRGVRRLAARPGAVAARRLFHLRHAGRHADRPADRRPWRAPSASTSGAPPACVRSAGRSYFLGRLLTGVIFGEAMLVSEPPGAARRRLALRAASFAAVGLAVLAVGGALFASEHNGQREIDGMAAALAAYEATDQGRAARSGRRRRSAAPAAAAERRPRSRPRRAGWRVSGGFGLSQADKLRAGAEAVYRHALEYALLPRLIWRLEAQMRGNLTSPDFLYEATRVYLMLGGQGPLDAGLVREWMTIDWQATYPGAFNAPDA